MKLRIDYTTRKVTIIENPTVFQYSHNIDLIEIRLDYYQAGLIYKVNFVDASGSYNLSRFVTYAGVSNGLHYYRILLNRENTLYSGNLKMAFEIYSADGKTKVWTSEPFFKYIEESAEDVSIDIDPEATEIIDEIYAQIGTKLNVTAKGYYKTSELSLGLTGQVTAQQLVTALLTNEDIMLTDSIIDIVLDNLILSEFQENVIGESSVFTYLKITTHGEVINGAIYGIDGGNYRLHQITIVNDVVTTQTRLLDNLDDTLLRTLITNTNNYINSEIQGVLDYINLEISTLYNNVEAHKSRTNNPHAVTKAQVGLGSVENYEIASQAEAQSGSVNNKYMTPLRTAERITAVKNIANGIAGLDSSGKIPLSLIKDEVFGQMEYAGVFYPSTESFPTQTNALDPNRAVRKGDYFIASDSGTVVGIEFNTGDWLIKQSTNWAKIDNTDAVASVNGKLGVVVLDGTDIEVGDGDPDTVKEKFADVFQELSDIYRKSETYTKAETNAIINTLKTLAGLESNKITFSSSIGTDVRYIPDDEYNEYSFLILKVKFTPPTPDAWEMIIIDVADFLTLNLQEYSVKPITSKGGTVFGKLVIERILGLTPALNVHMLDENNDIVPKISWSVEATGYKMRPINANQITLDSELYTAENVETALEEVKTQANDLETNKISKMSISNILLNANFSSIFNINDGWATTLATYDLQTNNNLVVLSPTARLGQLFQNVTLVSGRKYFLRASIKTSSADVRLQAYYPSGSKSLLELIHTGDGEYQTLSGIFEAEANAIVTIRVIDFKTSGWTDIEIKDFMLIDLTNDFGLENEPTTLILSDTLSDNFVNGYFVGTQKINALLGNVFGRVQNAEYSDLSNKIKNSGAILKYDNALSTVEIVFKISNEKNAKIVISKTGNNEIVMLKQFEIKNDIDFKFFSTADLVIGGTTDWISPFTMFANQNGDGDTSYTTTGGNHLMNGEKTAFTKTYSVIVDGNVIFDNQNNLFCQEVIVKVRNQVEGYNTHSLGRVILDEYVTYKFKDGKLEVEVLLVPIENITMLNYYGLQFTSPLASYFNSIQYVGSLNNEFNATVSDGTNSGILNVELLDTFVLNGDNVKFICGVDNSYGLGTRENTNGTDTSFMINGIKLYSNLIRKSTVMTARKPYFWKGYYKIK